MTDAREAREKVEDHALTSVPVEQRKSWASLSWNTVGIVTTLVALYVGALMTFVAGFWMGVLGGVIVTFVGSALAWGMGHIAYRSGLASGLVARRHGFGRKGSVMLSSIFGFMMIGFIAAENVLLYKGFIFFFGLEETLTSRILVYGTLSAIWIGLTTYGFDVVSRFSSIMLIGFLIMLFYMLAFIMLTTDQSWTDVLSFQTQMPSDALHALGVHSTADKLVFCINLLAGSLGALALLSADLGRYARSSADIGAAVVLGGSTLGIFMVSLGGILMYAGMPILVEHYASVRGLSEQQAIQVAVQDPNRVAAAFIVIGGTIGGILVVAAQAKAQVINTYSSSLSLSNFFDAIFAWQPGRFVFVVLANLLSLLLLYGDMLSWFHSFLKVLGILTTSFAGIILADYFIVGRLAQRWQLALQKDEMINWAGIVTIPTAFILAHIVLSSIIRVEILTGLAVAFILYPVLRLSVLRPMRCSKDPLWSSGSAEK